MVSAQKSIQIIQSWVSSWVRRFLAGSSPGRSLPAALITVAVGSILMTPFLSFVSSRSLGTGAAGETFNEQYAADAGVEFGAWSLLNNPTFRSQVDLNIGSSPGLGLSRFDQWIHPNHFRHRPAARELADPPIGSCYHRKRWGTGLRRGRPGLCPAGRQ